MPNRIIKESICYSEDIDKLTPFEETVFYRLLVRVDDYGRIDARPNFLKSMLFVTKKGITEKNIEDAVARLASVGLVQVYEVTGKPFLLFPKWSSHQRIRSSKEKYPAPQDGDIKKDSPQVAATCGELPPESNPNPNPNPNPNKTFCAEPEGSTQQHPVIELPLNDKTVYPISRQQVNEWVQLYPNVDIMQELRKMRGWTDANPAKRKTKKGILRFINSWLSKSQDKSNTNSRQQNKELTLTQQSRQKLKEALSQYDRENTGEVNRFDGSQLPYESKYRRV